MMIGIIIILVAVLPGVVISMKIEKTKNEMEERFNKILEETNESIERNKRALEILDEMK